MKNSNRIARSLLCLLLSIAPLTGFATTLEGNCGAPVAATFALPSKAPATCCSDPEPYPDWLGRAGLALSSTLGRIAADVVLREGHLLRFPQTSDYLTDRIQPLDFIAIQSDGHLSHVLLPGKFGHLAIYLGTADELRRFGIWNHPKIVPHHDIIRKGRAVLEADKNGVHLATFRSLLDADSIAILRPLLTLERRRSALSGLADHIGTPFDFRFDADDGSSLFCAELIAHAIPELDLPKRETYGRYTILPDEVAYGAAIGIGKLSVAGYVSATSLDWETGTPHMLRLAIDRAWIQPVFRKAGR